MSALSTEAGTASGTRHALHDIRRRRRRALQSLVGGIVTLLTASVSSCGGGETPSAPPAVAPTISASPVSQVVTAGTGATFTVTASGTGPLAYQWKRSGEAIANATGSSYTLSAAAMSDSGATFSVIVSNLAGSATSTAATLTVRRAVARLTITPALDSMRVDSVRQYAAVPEDASGVALRDRAVSWSVSDTAIATVSSTGQITARKAGFVTVNATSDGVSASRVLSVFANPGVPFATRGIKLWVGNLPGENNEYVGGTLNMTQYKRWKDILPKLKAMGVTDIMMPVSVGVMINETDNAYSDTLYFGGPREVLRAIANDTRALGMTVSIVLTSYIQNVPGGAIGLGRPNPADRKAWMAAHRPRVLDWATFADGIGARAMILFGDEVQHLVADPTLTSDWLGLIKDVKAAYRGQVTSQIHVGADAGKGLTSIPTAIISQLDYLGVGFFPNLVREDNPSVAALCAAYFKDADGNSPIPLLRSLAAQYGKKIWITDKAFHSFLGASADEARVFMPDVPLTPSEDVQAKLYETFFSVMQVEGRGWLEGASFDNYNNLQPGVFSIARSVIGPVSESPQDKLAEGVIASWFTGTRASGCPLR